MSCHNKYLETLSEKYMKHYQNNSNNNNHSCSIFESLKIKSLPKPQKNVIVNKYTVFHRPVKRRYFKFGWSSIC